MASESDSMSKSLTFSSSMRQASSNSLIFHCGNLLMLYSVRHSTLTDSGSCSLMTRPVSESLTFWPLMVQNS